MIDIEKMSILVVDDVKTMRGIIRNLLKGLNIGKTLYMAENGVEALKILNSARIDFALVDWKMPVMNGAQLVETIRNDHSLRDLPVVIISAESELDVVLDAAEIEVEAYLIKPLTPAILDQTIQSVVEQVNYPDAATLHIRHARLLEEKNNVPAAIEQMKKAVQLRPNASRILRNLGLLYQKNGDDITMGKCLKKAVAINPKDAISRYLLAKFFWKQKDLVSAADLFLEIISMTRKFYSQAMELGEELLEHNHSQLAKNIFSTMMSNAGMNLPLKEKIIGLCMEHKEFEYCKLLLKTAIKDHPSNHDLIYRMGDVCEQSGDQDKALECFLEVENRQPGNIDVKLKLARILLGKKKILRADDFLNQVLARDPNNRQALSLRQQM